MTEFTKKTSSPFRYDIVGSFLRPDYLLKAREDYKNKNISKSQLEKEENKAIKDLIKKEEDIGLLAITDGEFRRASWHCDFFWGLNGVEETYTDKGSVFNGDVYNITASLSGKISGENHPFVNHFKFVRDNASKNVEVKQTLPSPAQLVQELRRSINIEKTKKYYNSLEELVDDTVKAYATVLKDLKNAGCKVVQFDDCTWSRLISGKNHDNKEYTKEEFKELKTLYGDVINRVIENKPEGLTINTHVCRGNMKSTYFASGGYEPVANPLLTDLNYNAYYLEYDTERAGGFEVLKNVNENKYVVLGLVTTKFGKLENKDELLKRIEEASKYKDPDKLCISPQCGFSSNSFGNIISEEEQWEKIKLIKEVAKEFWGE